MRDDQALKIQPLVAVKQDVDVDDPGSPLPRPHPPAVSLDLLSDPQQAARRALPLAFDHLVEESGLILESPRLGLDDLALTRDSNPSLAQAPARCAQVP